MFSTKRYTCVPILNHLGQELTEQYEETYKFNDTLHCRLKPKRFKFCPVPKILVQSGNNYHSNLYAKAYQSFFVTFWDIKFQKWKSHTRGGFGEGFWTLKSLAFSNLNEIFQKYVFNSFSMSSSWIDSSLNPIRANLRKYWPFLDFQASRFWDKMPPKTVFRPLGLNSSASFNFFDLTHLTFFVGLLTRIQNMK